MSRTVSHYQRVVLLIHSDWFLYLLKNVEECWRYIYVDIWRRLIPLINHETYICSIDCRIIISLFILALTGTSTISRMTHYSTTIYEAWSAKQHNGVLLFMGNGHMGGFRIPHQQWGDAAPRSIVGFYFEPGTSWCPNFHSFLKL